MLLSKARTVVVTCGMAAVLSALPSTCQACFGFHSRPPAPTCPTPTATTFAPPYTAQRISYMPVVNAACTACMPVSQTCSYVPQTSYRWSYSRMQVTSYRPVTVSEPRPLSMKSSTP